MRREQVYNHLMEAKKKKVQLLLSIPQCLSQFSTLIIIMGIPVPDVQLLTKGKEDLRA